MKASLKNLAVYSALATALGFTTTVHAVSILVDPGAESQISTTNPPSGYGQGWAMFNGAAFSNAFAHSGTWSIRTSGPGGFTVPGAVQQFAALPGDAFTMTGFGMTTAPLAAGATFGVLQITYFSGPNGTGTNLGTVETSPGNARTSAQINNTSPTNTWIPLTVTATAPAGTQSLQAFTLTLDQNAAPIYWDDLTLTNAPEPGSLALAGLGGVAILTRRRRK
jgi:hypothetical protein